MKELPVRKHPRLKNYDYSQDGVYFITFCVKERHEMLGRLVGRDDPGAPHTGHTVRQIGHIAPHIELSEHGKIT